MTPSFNFLCRDIDRQFAFYQALLGWDDDSTARSPIFRALLGGGVQLGFNAEVAYALLGLADRMPTRDPAPVTAYPTFELASPAHVDTAAARASALGGRIVKVPFATYYGQWQVVLADPESNVLRLAAGTLPAGIAAAPKPF